ncbi:MSMEG_0572 family nitrogen starvation response protein [Geomonas subterranea]|uniref:MSMEG_0572 family nitrogen starvation response protein n=1 Tax=Geomonas subterranea TaxID=2847989 RepID=A0ABX8LME1_9BACT|nr:MSMEG_0572/Sll0783 family nitrogen starvation response protein [Geomonas subterranea]QXE92659.1 MSMEG_0572 family nitrogen starvation response protein [Geomonas subterranea]QXM09242.1 MSMEG_0572 family nitrogen starvation response protein [Geomonas subterranea]
MARVKIQRPQPGDAIVNDNPKMYEDYKAREGDKALITMHTVPFEGSVGLINLLTCTRLVRKGYKVTLLLYGPGVLMAAETRGYPNVGDDAFPGNQAINNQIKTILKEGGRVLACRFAMAALYGHREEDMIEGVEIIHQLDVLDCLIEHQRSGALIIQTWTV